MQTTRQKGVIALGCNLGRAINREGVFMRVARPLLSALAAPGGPTPLLLLRGGNAAPGAREFFDHALTVVNCGSGLLLLCGCALALINSASLLLNKLFRGSLPFVGGFAQSIDKNEVKVEGLSGIKGVITVGRIRLQLGSLIMVRIGDQKAPAEWGF